MNLDEAIDFLKERIEKDDKAEEAKVILKLIEESNRGEKRAAVDVGEANMMLVFTMVNNILGHKGRAAGVEGQIRYIPEYPLF